MEHDKCKEVLGSEERVRKEMLRSGETVRNEVSLERECKEREHTA